MIKTRPDLFIQGRIELAFINLQLLISQVTKESLMWNSIFRFQTVNAFKDQAVQGEHVEHGKCSCFFSH